MTDKTKVKKPSRQNRFFSDEFKKQKVKELEENLITITEISQDYGVSRTAVYKWIYKYSIRYAKGVRQVVEMESEQEKTNKLKARLSELEQIIGQKQMKIDFLEKMIEIGNNEMGIDLKKKFSTPPFNGSEPTEKSTNIR